MAVCMTLLLSSREKKSVARRETNRESLFHCATLTSTKCVTIPERLSSRSAHYPTLHSLVQQFTGVIDMLDNLNTVILMFVNNSRKD